MEPIRIFIGTEPNQWLPTVVLKSSIRRRTSAPLEFNDLKGIELNLKVKMYTGFSFFRYHIPELCGYRGRGIYLDADMVCRADIKELFEMDMKGKGALSKVKDKKSYYTSCLLLDCERLKHWNIKEWALLINAGLTSYWGIMSGDPSGINHDDFGPLDDVWNHFDRYYDSTKIIHYTTVPTQPWKKPGHPYRDLFLKEMKETILAGDLTLDEVRAEIKKEHIYPNIIDDMEKAASI